MGFIYETFDDDTMALIAQAAKRPHDLQNHNILSSFLKRPLSYGLAAICILRGNTHK